MKKILIATTNPGKLSEIKYFLKDLPVELVGLADLGIRQKVIEDGQTFEENAKKKALFYAKISGLPTIADDGGLEIDILNGEPGVKSRRWINNEEASDEELIDYTIKCLKGVPQSKRSARLKAALVLAFPSGEVFTSEEFVKGVIAEKQSKRWTRGFPFRAIFYLPQIKKFYNEKKLTKKELAKYNHRGKALKKIKRIIAENLLK